MKRYVMSMCNIHPRRTGLSVNIWSDGQGVLRNKPDDAPRIKLKKNDAEISVTIEPNPKVFAPKGDWKHKFKKSDVIALEDGIDYIGRNYDLFLEHYMDTSGDFDDLDLFNALADRGELK